MCYHFQSARCNRIHLDLLPLTVQIATWVPGCRGGWWSDTLVIILHLKPDWSPQAPEDIQQALKDQLPLFLLGDRNYNQFSYRHIDTHNLQVLDLWDKMHYRYSIIRKNRQQIRLKSLDIQMLLQRINTHKHIHVESINTHFSVSEL